jgi:hypothetical protein
MNSAFALTALAGDNKSSKSIFDLIFDSEENKVKKEKSLDEQLKASGLIDQQLDVSKIIAQSSKGDFHSNAIINVINKKNGKMEILNVSIAKPLVFQDNIVIRLLSCWKESSKRVCPDNRALIEFYTILPERKLTKNFQGWIFSRTPSSASYLHQKYEFILDSCTDK